MTMSLPHVLILITVIVTETIATTLIVAVCSAYSIYNLTECRGQPYEADTVVTLYQRDG